MTENYHWTRESARRHLETYYEVPGSGVTYSTVSKIFDFYNKKLPIQEIENFLSKQNTHTLHRQNKNRARTHVPVHAYDKRMLLEMDLVDISQLYKVGFISLFQIFYTYINI